MMDRRFVSLLLVIGLLLPCFVVGRSTYRRKNRKPRPSNEATWDFMIFTQHWPQTSCFTWEEDHPTHQCNLPQLDEWGIHGIWPNRNHTELPDFCNKSMKFDVASLAPIRKEMETKWIDIHKGSNPADFWRHEWEKHGTCATQLEALNSEIKYFKKGLELFDLYDMKHVLAKANILPGQNLHVQAYLDGLKKVLGKQPMVDCIKNHKTKDTYLAEIRICLDKQFQLIDCDAAVGYPTNCKRRVNIIYPSKVPPAGEVIMIG